MAKNTLEGLNKDSLVVVHRSGSDLADKTAKQDTQGIKVSRLSSFENIHPTSFTDPATDAEENYKYGESFVIHSPSGATRYINMGEFGKTVRVGDTLHSTAALKAGGSFANGTYSNKTPVYSGTGQTSSQVPRLDIVIGSGAITSITVDRAGTFMTAGETLTIEGADVGGSTGTDDIIITLSQTQLNNAHFVKEAFTNI